MLADFDETVEDRPIESSVPAGTTIGFGGALAGAGAFGAAATVAGFVALLVGAAFFGVAAILAAFSRAAISASRRASSCSRVASVSSASRLASSASRAWSSAACCASAWAASAAGSAGVTDAAGVTSDDDGPPQPATSSAATAVDRMRAALGIGFMSITISWGSGCARRRVGRRNRRSGHEYRCARGRDPRRASQEMHRATAVAAITDGL
jgi:hypothetical protein